MTSSTQLEIWLREAARPIDSITRVVFKQDLFVIKLKPPRNRFFIGSDDIYDQSTAAECLWAPLTYHCGQRRVMENDENLYT
jgi:hypothetical protein